MYMLPTSLSVTYPVLCIYVDDATICETNVYTHTLARTHLYKNIGAGYPPTRPSRILCCVYI